MQQLVNHNMEYFKLIRIGHNSLLVIVLTCEMTEIFWNSLCDSILQTGISDGEMYMDYSYRNGDSNFSFYATITNYKIQQTNIKRCVFPKVIDRELVKFYKANKNYIVRSNMSRRKKMMLLEN